MAHFAELDADNMVKRVIVVSNSDTADASGVEKEYIGAAFCERLLGGTWKQTSYNGNIRKRDITSASPYNTYVIYGLPPTPIAMPGKAAIYAALHPAPGESLYFVAKGDGSHYFSATLNEHNNAVMQYQIKNRNHNYTSRPQDNHGR